MQVKLKFAKIKTGISQHLDQLLFYIGHETITTLPLKIEGFKKAYLGQPWHPQRVPTTLEEYHVTFEDGVTTLEERLAQWPEPGLVDAINAAANKVFEQLTKKEKKHEPVASSPEVPVGQLDSSI